MAKRDSESFVAKLTEAFVDAREFKYTSQGSDSSDALWELLGYPRLPDTPSEKNKFKAVLISLVMNFTDSPYDRDLLLMSFGLLRGYEDEEDIGMRRERCLRRSSYTEKSKSTNRHHNNYIHSTNDVERNRILDNAKDALRKNETVRMRKLAEFVENIPSLPSYITSGIADYHSAKRPFDVIFPEATSVLKINSEKDVWFVSNSVEIITDGSSKKTIKNADEVAPRSDEAESGSSSARSEEKILSQKETSKKEDREKKRHGSYHIPFPKIKKALLLAGLAAVLIASIIIFISSKHNKENLIFTENNNQADPNIFTLEGNTDYYQLPVESFNMALNLFELGEITRAKEIMEKSADDAMADNAISEQVKISYLFQLAELYLLCGEVEKSNTQYHRALAKMNDKDISSDVYAHAYLNLSLSYNFINQEEKSLICIDKALEHLKMLDKVTPLQIASVYFAYGKTFLTYEEIENHYLKAISYYYIALMDMLLPNDNIHDLLDTEKFTLEVETEGVINLIDINPNETANQMDIIVGFNAGDYSYDCEMSIITDFRLRDYDYKNITQVEMLETILNDTIWNPEFFVAKTFSEDELTLIIGVMKEMGIALHNSMCYSDAIDVLTFAETLIEKYPSENENDKATILHLMGMSYICIDDFLIDGKRTSNGQEKIEKAISVYERTGSFRIAHAYADLGRCYRDIDEEKVNEYTDLALEKCAEYFGKNSEEYEEFKNSYLSW